MKASTGNKAVKTNKSSAITTINPNMSVTGLGGAEMLSEPNKEVLKLSNLIIFILDFPEKTGQKKAERWDLIKKVYACPQFTDGHLELTTEECNLIISVAETVLINPSIFGFLKDQLSN